MQEQLPTVLISRLYDWKAETSKFTSSINKKNKVTEGSAIKMRNYLIIAHIVIWLIWAGIEWRGLVMSVYTAL